MSITLGSGTLGTSTLSTGTLGASAGALGIGVGFPVFLRARGAQP